SLTLSDFKGLNSDRIGVSTPSAVLNLRRELGDTDLLANPKIRAKNHEKAKILIGDKLPVITTTSTSTGFVSESVQYIDVGLKLE
ncbi:type IV pilus secretin PilQ, partial [Ralstonia solanacearum species complex bacterium KE055]